MGKTVKNLYSRCENFLANLQIGEDDDFQSEFDQDDLDRLTKSSHEADGGGEEFTSRGRRRKRFQASGGIQGRFFLQILAFSILVEGYFVYNYIISATLIKNLNQVSSEFNSTSIAETFVNFVHNSFQYTVMDPTLPILGGSSEEQIYTSIQELFGLDSIISQEHAKNLPVHNENFRREFNDIYLLNPCRLFQNITIAECEAWAEGSVAQGMAVALTRTYENLRFLLTLHGGLLINSSLPLPAGTNITQISSDPLQNKLLNLLNTLQAKELSVSIPLYVKQAFRLLMVSFQNFESDEYNAMLGRRLAYFILFNVFIVFFYIVLWLPVITGLNKSMWRTKTMLVMIPIQIVSKIRVIRVYLRKFLIEKKADF
eukprot:TRINITY_DN10546_c0_g3_i3.p1 TRINITY_DN10546_c0_g3~~TRINITY_DN10546_c0_g3_i3.p1  ORF type:complete len:371 (-),score=82.29 TRINITY_DN10546_c0_g3_i3:29-1141(-)